MDRKIFIDPGNDKVFKEQGFLKTELLDLDTVNILKAVATDPGFKTAGMDKKKLSGINVSLYDTRKDLRQVFFDRVWKTIQKKLGAVVYNYEPVMINFWSKTPGGGSLELHQNWTHVDEDKYTSISLWIPLQPTSRKNGTLEIVPGSQRKILGIRGPGIDHVFKNIENHIVSEYLLPVNLQMGEAVFIDDSILHYTGHNQDVNNRDSIQVLLKPIEADALFFIGDRKETDNTIKCFEVERSFFSNLSPGALSEETLQYAKQVKTITRSFKQLTLEEFKGLMGH